MIDAPTLFTLSKEQKQHLVHHHPLLVEGDPPNPWGKVESSSVLFKWVSLELTLISPVVKLDHNAMTLIFFAAYVRSFVLTIISKPRATRTHFYGSLL